MHAIQLDIRLPSKALLRDSCGVKLSIERRNAGRDGQAGLVGIESSGVQRGWVLAAALFLSARLLVVESVMMMDVEE